MDQTYVVDGYIDNGYFTIIAMPNVSLVSDYTITANDNRLRNTSTQLNSNFTEIGNNTRLRDVTTQLTSTFDDTVNNTRLRNATISLNSNYTLLSKIVTSGNVIQLLSNFNLSNTPTVNRSTNIALNTILTLSLQSVRIVEVSVNLQTNYTLKSAISDTVSLVSNFSINEVPTKVISSSVNMTSNFTSSITNNTIKHSTINVNSNYTVNSINNRIRNSNGIFSTINTLVVNSSREVDNIITLSSHYTILSIAGRPVIKYVYVIPYEERVWIVNKD